MSSDNDNFNTRKRNEQCMLLHYMGSEARSDPEGAGAGFVGLRALNESCKYTSFIPIKGEPTEMMSTLTGRSDLNSVMSLTPFQLSFLVPKIRLYKTYIGEGPGAKKHEGKTWDVEMMFSDSISGIISGDTQTESKNRLTKMLASRAGRGTGVGIKGFSWKYEGTNPAEAANLLTANLSLHFNDVSELFEKRGPFEATVQPVDDPDRPDIKKDCYFQYVDLIMRTAETGQKELPDDFKETDNWCKWMWLYNPEHFELKAVVGWETKPGAPFSQSQTEVLKSASVILYLTIVDHVISYNEDGTMGLDISYRAAIESILEDTNADLLISTFERTRQAQVEAMRRAFTSGRSQTVTSNGDNIVGERDSLGTAKPNSAQSGADETSKTDKDLAKALENHLAELRDLTRNMSYSVLQAWISDRTPTPELDTSMFEGHEGRKLAKDVTDWSEAEPPAAAGGIRIGGGGSSANVTTAGGDTAINYGAPWPLSYGKTHGAEFSGGRKRASGLMRVKEIFVKPSWVGASEEEEKEPKEGAAHPFILSQPIWQAYETDTRAGDEAGTQGILDNVPTPGTHDSETNSAVSAEMSKAMIDNASPADSKGGTPTTDFDDLLRNTVNSKLYHQHTNVTLPQDIKDALGDKTYPVRFIYYGDLLDWAIRKALWRPPYTPDQSFAALDKFANLASDDNIFKGWQKLNEGGGLEDWDKARLKTEGSTASKGIRGPGGKNITIEDWVEDLWRIKERKFDKINIILGCVEYFDPVARKSMHINLADIPISLNRWNEWFINKMQRPGVYSYSLRQFIKETLNSLVLDVLGGKHCYGDGSDFSKQIFDIGISNFTLPAYKNADGEYENPAKFLTDSSHYINAGEDGTNFRVDLKKIQASLDKRSLFEINEDNTEVYHFIAIYARGYESSTLLGLETDAEAKSAVEEGFLKDNPRFQGAELPGDLSRGIFHFYMGHNQGLVKSIKFNRTDQKYLAESRILGQGHFGYNQLRGRYEATIVLQGNTFFLPGQYIYINPRSVGSGDWGSEYEDAALLLGLGGYYVVLDIESSITPEFYETTLKCVWHGSGRQEVCNLNDDDQENLASLGATFTQEEAASFAASLQETQIPKK